MISGPGELLSTDVRGMAEHLQLSEAISRYVQDGDTVAIEGIHASDSVRRRSRDHPPGETGSHGVEDDPGSHL